MITNKINLIPTGTKRRSGIKNLGIKFLVAHDTGNPNTTAGQNVNYYINSANEASASAHVFVDDKEIIWCIPENEKAWHVWYSTTIDNKRFNADSNDSAIGVELCYFPQDIAKTRLAYENYTDLLASLCDKYKLDPLVHIPGHNDLDPARKTDPMNAFRVIGKTMIQFRTDVRAKLKSGIPSPIKPKLITLQFGQTGVAVGLVQDILNKNGYLVSPFTGGVYNEAMAQAILLFQIRNKVATEAEISKLRGEVTGPKTIAALTLIQ